MSRRGPTTRAKSPRANAPRKPGPRRHKAGRSWLLALALVLLVVAGAVGLRIRAEQGRRPEPVARDVALKRGLLAVARGDDLEAEAWFRRGLASFPRDPLLQINLSTALNNKCFRVHPRRGVPMPVLATSLERFRVAQESLRLYRTIEAGLPRGIGLPHDRAQLFDTWGMPLDAMEDYLRAQAIGDTTRACRDAIARISMLQSVTDGSAALRGIGRE